MWAGECKSNLTTQVLVAPALYSQHNPLPLFLCVRLMGRSCQQVVLANVWVTGGKEISLLLGLWRRTFRRLAVHFSTKAALEFSRVTSALCLPER